LFPRLLLHLLLKSLRLLPLLLKPLRLLLRQKLLPRLLRPSNSHEPGFIRLQCRMSNSPVGCKTCPGFLLNDGLRG
jgi:hypothetical protein